MLCNSSERGDSMVIPHTLPICPASCHFLLLQVLVKYHCTVFRMYCAHNAKSVT